MLLDQPREIDVEQDVGGVDEEGAARQERFSVLERAARAEDRVLGKEGDPVAPARRPGPGTQQLGLPVQVDADRALRDRRESLQDPLDDRLAQDRQERLGQVIRHGSQPFAQAGSGKADREWTFRHLQELSAEGGASQYTPTAAGG